MNNKPNHMKNRQRGRNNNGGKPRPPGGGGGGGGGPRNPNFDNGMRPRGNAQQLMEKFLAMARDASAMGDRVAAENYYQHADHYYRVLNARFEAQQQQNQHQNQNQNQNQNQGYNNGQQRRPDQGQRYDRPTFQGDGPGDGQGDEQSNQNFDRGGYEQRPQYDRPNYEQRPNYNQGNYQNEAPRHTENQPQAEQPSVAPPAQQSYEPQPSHGPMESDIGLPPQVLGLAEQAPQPAAAEGESQSNEAQGNEGQGDARSPRRRRGRGQGAPRQPNAES